MIGDAYFQLRSQIGTNLFSLAKFARDLGASEAALSSLQELQASLRDPFLFVTLGEAGAGKSSVLNTLFGRDFAGEASLAGRAAVFRHNSEAQDVPLTAEIVEAQRPHIFLRDFAIVEAPGFGTWAATPEVLQRFVPAADIILFIFSATNGSQAAWDFLAHSGQDFLKRTLFLVQQADAVEGDVLMSTVLALHDRLRETLGEGRPIFPVSAHTRAGMEKLERYLDTEVICSAPRFQRLREICIAADEFLFELGAKTRTTAENAELKLKLAEEQQLVLADARDEALRGLDRDLWSLTQIFEAAQRRGGELLRRRIDQRSLWKSKIEWRDNLHHELEDRVREGAVRNAQLAAEHCDATLREAWNAQLEELRKCGADGLGAFPDDCAPHVANLEKAIAESDPLGVSTGAVTSRFTSLGVLFRIPALVFAVSVVLLIVAWSVNNFIGIAVVFAGLAFAVTAFAPTILRENLAKVLRETMFARRENILSRVEAEMRKEIERIFAELKANLIPLGECGARERTESEPMLTRLLQLADLFDRSIAEIEACEARANEPAPNAD